MTDTATAPPRHLDTRTEPAPPGRRQWIGLTLLLLGTAGAYLWNLSANGWANSFYAAAVQAGSVSWKAFFFGSSDAANAITVDKTPAALWPMELSARLFGFTSWSMLLPQVLLGVASVALLWATVRRHHGHGAGLLAGLVLAVTPVVALMFRFNNPDALLVFLMIAAVWAMLRAVESGRWRWLVLCGLFMGFGFLAKQLQVMLVLPALAGTYLFAGPPKLGTRVLQLLAAGASMVAGAGWWVLIAQLWPSDSRPYFGGSQNNSIIELTLGYNGLGRLNGDETGSVGMGGELPPGGNGMWGETGFTRLFEPAQGGQIAWLMPAALVLLVVALVLRGTAPRTDTRRAALMVWGGWLLVTALTFSFMQGIFHSYYTVALAPAVAALTGIGAVQLWRHRDRWWVRVAAAATLAVTTATAWLLLSRTADFVPWLRWVILFGGIATSVVLLMRLPSRRAAVAAVLAGVFALAGPLAYSVDTLASAHTGAIPTAGPDVRKAGRLGSAPMGNNGPSDGAIGQFGPEGRGSSPDTGGRGGGGLLDADTPGDQLVALLKNNATAYTWVAAASGSMTASGYQLATMLPVMSIGGFNGSDPYPTLEQFQQYVADGQIHYFIAGGGMSRGAPNSSGSAQITEWVVDNFTAREVDGVTVYDLTEHATP